MRKSIFAFASVLLSASLAFAVYTTGWGLTVNVTPAVASSRDFTVGQLSVYNSGAAAILVMVNTTTNDFTNAVAAGTAVPVPSNSTYTFDSAAQTAIYNVFYQSAGATTNTVYFGGF